MIIERPALERRVLASIAAGRIPVVLGGCGTGRTSLLLRLERGLGADRAHYVDVSAAATTPERCLSSVLHSTRAGRNSGMAAAPTTARASFDALLDFFDASRGADGRPATFLLDEFLDVRTFESFPGLRHAQRDLVARLADSPIQFVLASRFTARVHRLLRDAPARFEVIHVPALVAAEVLAMAGPVEAERRTWTADVAPSVAALAGGRAAAVHMLLETIASHGPSVDPVAALAALFAPDGRLTARCRESYEFRLHRARGYGALKAILGILAEQEPLNLTEIAQRLHRTPGSTKDYLSWLEDVDLITAQGKRYAYEDPLLRLYVRLYARPVPPSDDDIVRDVNGYAAQRIGGSPRAAAQPSTAAATRTVEETEAARASGIIEID